MVFYQQILSFLRNFLRKLITRKSYNVLESEFNTKNPLNKCLSATLMIGLGLGGSIGHTIFVLSGNAAAIYAGPSIIISFLIGAIVALFSAFSMSQMSSFMSSSGSAYTYAYVVLGEYPAFIMGWLLTLLYQLGTPVVVVSWSRSVVYFINLITDYNITTSLAEAPVAWSSEFNMFYSTGHIINLPAIAITVAVTIVLVIGIRETAIVNFILVVIKVVFLLIFIFACCIYVDRKNYTPFIPPNLGSFDQYGVTGMLRASSVVFFGYFGFESVTTVAQEARQPARSMPSALLVSLAIFVLIYMGVCTVIVGLVPYQALNTAYPLIRAAEATPYGRWLPILLSLGAICSLTTVAITLLLTQSRIYYAMAVDNLLPSIFTRIQKRTKTPWVSTVISGVVCIILSSVCPIDVLGEMASIAALIVSMFIHVCVIVMYYRPDIPRPMGFRVPLGPWLLPVVGILLCILLLINTTEGTAIRFGIWMGIGHIFYFSYGFWHSKVHMKKHEGSSASANELAPSETAVIPDTPGTDVESASTEETHF